MNWIGISENIVAAVFGALILSIVYWLVSVAKSRKPVEWFVVGDGATQSNPDEYQSTVAFCIMVIRNRSRTIARDVEILFNNPVSSLGLPSGTKAEVISKNGQHRIQISAVQAKSDLEIIAQSAGEGYLIARKVFVGDEDMGDSLFVKHVRSDAMVLPWWFGPVVLPILIGFFANLALGTFIDESHNEHETSPVQEEQEPTQ